jgi:hypothetical protein
LKQPNQLNAIQWIPINQIGLEALRAASQFIKSHRSLWLYISLSCFATPVLISALMLGVLGDQGAAAIRDAIAGGEAKSIYPLMDIMTHFLLFLCGALAVCWFAMSLGYLAIIQGVFYGMSMDSLGPYLKRSLWLTIVRGIPLVLLAIVFLAIFQRAMILLFIAGALSLKAPLLLAQQPKLGIFALVGRLVTLKFIPPQRENRWAIFFQVISHGAFMFGGLMLVGAIGQVVTTLDQWLPLGRTWFLPLTPQIPFSFWYLVGSAIEAILVAGFLGFFAVFSAVYHELLWGRLQAADREA